MTTKITKWGNSLGIRISKTIADELGLKPGTEIDVNTVDGKILISPKIKDLTMDELLHEMTADDVLDQFEEIEPLGLEKVWNKDGK